MNRRSRTQVDKLHLRSVLSLLEILHLQDGIIAGSGLQDARRVLETRACQVDASPFPSALVCTLRKKMQQPHTTFTLPHHPPAPHAF